MHGEAHHHHHFHDPSRKELIAGVLITIFVIYIGIRFFAAWDRPPPFHYEQSRPPFNQSSPRGGTP